MTPAALDRHKAATYLSLSVSTLEALVRRGEAPAARELSPGRVAWLRSELDAWLAERPVSQMLPPPTRRTGRPSRLPAETRAL